MLNSRKIKYSISIQIFTEKGFKNSFVDFLRRAKTPILRSNYMMELNSVLTGNQISFSVGKLTLVLIERIGLSLSQLELPSSVVEVLADAEVYSSMVGESLLLETSCSETVILLLPLSSD